MLNEIKNLVTEEEGQGMTEYGLLLAVIVVVVVVALASLKTSITGLFNDIQTKLEGAIDEVK